MMMHKKLQKILAIALMTSFFSTSFLMGVSEAAPARHAGGQRPAQTQQVRPVHKSSSGHAIPDIRARPFTRTFPNSRVLACTGAHSITRRNL